MISNVVAIIAILIISVAVLFFFNKKSSTPSSKQKDEGIVEIKEPVQKPDAEKMEEKTQQLPQEVVDYPYSEDNLVLKFSPFTGSSKKKTGSTQKIKHLSVTDKVLGCAAEDGNIIYLYRVENVFKKKNYAASCELDINSPFQDEIVDNCLNSFDISNNSKFVAVVADYKNTVSVFRLDFETDASKINSKISLKKLNSSSNDIKAKEKLNIVRFINCSKEEDPKWFITTFLNSDSICFWSTFTGNCLGRFSTGQMSIFNFDLSKSENTDHSFFCASGFSSTIKIFKISKEKEKNPEKNAKIQDSSAHYINSVNSDSNSGLSFEKYTELSKLFENSIDSTCFNPCNEYILATVSGKEEKLNILNILPYLVEKGGLERTSSIEAIMIEKKFSEILSRIKEILGNKKNSENLLKYLGKENLSKNFQTVLISPISKTVSLNFKNFILLFPGNETMNKKLHEEEFEKKQAAFKVIFPEDFSVAKYSPTGNTILIGGNDGFVKVFKI